MWRTGSALLITAVALLLYSNTLQVPFVFDDTNQIVENAYLHDLGAVSSIWRFHLSRTVTFITFALNYHVHQLDVTGYHVVNTAIHIGASLCLWYLVLLTFACPALKHHPLSEHKYLAALAAGLIFAAHPVQTQAVTYIVQRLASLAGFFYLAALCAYVSWRLAPAGFRAKAPRAGLFVVAALLGLFTKETLYTLPLVIFVYEAAFMQEKPAINWRAALFCAPLLLAGPLTIAYMKPDFLQLSYHLGDERVTQLTPGIYLLTQVRVLATYLRLLVLPVNQNLDYDYPVFTSPFDPEVVLSLCLHLALIALAVWVFPRNRPAAFGILWFFITLAPESSIIPIRDVIFEHRLYLPMGGFCFAAAGLTSALLCRGYAKPAGAVLAAVILALGLLTWQRNAVWSDPYSLWNDAVTKSPRKARPYSNRGLALHGRGLYEKAVADYDQALRLGLKTAEVFDNRGLAYAALGRYDKALEDFTTALAVNPKYAPAYYNRGIAHGELGRMQEAIADFTAALAGKPAHAKAAYNRGCAHHLLGDHSSALEDYTRALALQPAYPAAYLNRGSIHLEMNNPDAAYRDFQSALLEDPDSIEAYQCLARYYGMQGDTGRQKEMEENMRGLRARKAQEGRAPRRNR